MYDNVYVNQQKKNVSKLTIEQQIKQKERQHFFYFEAEAFGIHNSRVTRPSYVFVTSQITN